MKFTKKNFKNLCKGVVLMLILAISFNSFTKYFIPDNRISVSRIIKFNLLNKNSIDTLFVGNSHLYRGILPQIIDNKVNTNSFLLTSSNADFQMYYVKLKKALKKQTPKTVVLDLYNINNENMVGSVHAHADYNPLTIENIKIINSHIEKEKQIEFYIPMFTSHLRWKQAALFPAISTRLKINKYDNFFGEIISPVSINNNFVPLLPVDEKKGENLGFANGQEKYFDKIIELCKKNNINLLLVSMPFLKQSFSNNDMDKFVTEIKNKSIVKDNNIQVFDFNKLYDELDLTSSDMFDEGHLNIFGSAKLSNYFADYLQKENYVEVKNISEEEKKIKEQNFNEIMEKYNNSLHTRNEIFTLKSKGITSTNNARKDGKFVSNSKDGELLRSGEILLEKGEYLLYFNIKNNKFKTPNLGKIEVLLGDEKKPVYSYNFTINNFIDDNLEKSANFFVPKDSENVVICVTTTEGSVLTLNDVSVGVMPKDPASYVYNK